MVPRICKPSAQLYDTKRSTPVNLALTLTNIQSAIFAQAGG
jgi:hypothetical protein